MKKILFSLASIAAVGIIAFGATQAFFSDTETSEGNVLVAGALDLKIDNTCYYNGNACIKGVWAGDELRGQPCSCTWTLDDLDKRHVFFNLFDLKPGDWEEDTISLHVFDNNAWACADFKVTENDDNKCTEPELEAGDLDCDSSSKFDGDLADELKFIFWEDDGDNVFEKGERPLEQLEPAFLKGVKLTIADSGGSIFNPESLSEEEGALIGSRNYYIGKAFCYGKLGLDPSDQDGLGGVGTPQNPDNIPNGPDFRRTGGITCDGKPVGNKSQTDKLMGDVSFYAEQSRNNPDFLCNPEPTPTPSPTPSPTPEPPPIS